MVDFFDEGEKVKIIRLFREIDDNNSGTISARELQKFLKQSGIDIDIGRAKEIIDEHDGGAGKLDFEHFCIAIGTAFAKFKAAFILLSLFREFDVNNTGFISAADLVRLSLETAVDLNPREIHAIIDSCDKTGDGLISFPEYALALVKCLRDR